MDMDYVVGSIADLIAGNLTPSRPASVKRALTPVKHRASPRVTPRGESLSGGRDALLSPSVLRKKAIVKKSPKRIFERDDLDKTAEENIIKSPKVDKVKKHLQADLDESKEVSDKVKSPKRKREIQKEMTEEFEVTELREKNKKRNNDVEVSTYEESTVAVEQTETKKNKKGKLKNYTEAISTFEVTQDTSTVDQGNEESPVKKRNKNKNNNIEIEEIKIDNKKSDTKSEEQDTAEITLEKKGKKKNRKKKKNKSNAASVENRKLVKANDEQNESDSEHDSDDEIESETEQDVKQILDSGPIEGENSSDDEEHKSKKTKVEKKKEQETSTKKERPVIDEEETRRTLFVGNVPLSKKCKKDIKQIFLKYGAIESVRIRTIPVKDLRTNPKVALIKNEIHPERSSVNVYVKFSDESSVTAALRENNRLMGEHHLRVTRSDTSGLHDPRKTIFVGNIPFGIEDETLRATFERCGEIDSVRIVRDKVSQIGKGFGYVNFKSSDGVELALNLSEEDLSIKNRIMRIRRYTQAQPGQKVKSKLQGQRPNRFNQGNRGGHGNQNEQGSRSYQGGNQGNRGDQWSKNTNFNMKPREDSGALKRINNKRKFQDSSPASTAPAQKKPKNLDQPTKEKKAKKEFVGMTAEKKKKKKFDKGQKKKQKLSEILTKKK